jgi:hypothetical protein
MTKKMRRFNESVNTRNDAQDARTNKSKPKPSDCKIKVDRFFVLFVLIITKQIEMTNARINAVKLTIASVSIRNASLV